MASSEFQLFRESLASGDAAYREDFDIRALLELTGEERTDAEDLLIQRLLGAPDPRVPRALGYARVTRALPELEYGVVTHSNAAAMRAEVVLAIWKISEDPRVPGWLREILASGGNTFGRNIAAHALRDFPGAASEQALRQAIQRDPSELVRINAATSLFTLLQIPPGGKGSKIAHLWSWLSSDLVSLRRRGTEQLEALLADQAAGKPLDAWLERPASRSADMKAFVKALRADPTLVREFPQAELSRLEGLERRHAIHVLLAAVERQDPRAPRALTELQAGEYAEALEESIDAPGEFGLEVAAALHRWGRPAGRAKLEELAATGGPLAARAQQSL